MYLNTELLIESLILSATNNGAAYRDNKNALKAWQAAKSEALQTFREALTEVESQVIAGITESWKDEAEARNAERDENNNFWEGMRTGAICRATERMYNEMLEILPPAYQKGSTFAVGEPYSSATDGEDIHAFFWYDADGNYWAKYMALHTRRNLSESGKITY